MYHLVHMIKLTKPQRIQALIVWLKETPADLIRTKCQEFKTTPEYIRQIAYGYKVVGPIKGVAIQRATGVARELMRPNDYWDVWPDLKAPTSEDLAKK